MFEALGDHAQRQSLHAGDGLVTVGTVAQDARQTGHFGEPTAMIFAPDLNRKNHPGTVPSGPLSNKEWRRRPSVVCKVAACGALLIRER